MLLTFVATTLLGVAAAISPLRRAACNRDNCFRDVFGTQQVTTRPAVGTAACSSYLLTTITPCTVTTTTTTTYSGSTTTVTATTNPLKRDVALEARVVSSCPSTSTASAVPAFASDCTGTRFSSVCQCAGITASTVTLATPTLTVTSTVTQVQTVSVNRPAPTCDIANSRFSVLGSGGCPSNCYCDRLTADASVGVCDDDNICRGSCETSADCASGQVCVSGTACSTPNGKTCQIYTGCLSSVAKRELEGGADLALRNIDEQGRELSHVGPST